MLVLFLIVGAGLVTLLVSFALSIFATHKVLTMGKSKVGPQGPPGPVGPKGDTGSAASLANKVFNLRLASNPKAGGLGLGSQPTTKGPTTVSYYSKNVQEEDKKNLLKWKLVAAN